MTVYKIQLERTVIEYVTVEVGAASEDEAKKLALDVANALDWETDFASYGATQIAEISVVSSRQGEVVNG